MIHVDQAEKERRSVFRQLAAESDRGAALVGCSVLEESLEQLLRSRMSGQLIPNTSMDFSRAMGH